MAFFVHVRRNLITFEDNVEIYMLIEKRSALVVPRM